MLYVRFCSIRKRVPDSATCSSGGRGRGARERWGGRRVGAAGPRWSWRVRNQGILGGEKPMMGTARGPPAAHVDVMASTACLP